MSKEQRISRREFLRTSSGAVTAAGLATALHAKSPLAADSPAVDRLQFTQALGDTLIPTAAGYPGYKRLEQYGISQEVMKTLTAISDSDLATFNGSSADFFGGKTFLNLGADQREQYLRLIIDGQKIPDQSRRDTLQKVYRLYRTRVFTVFYQNFPENKLKRDAQGVPILPPGEQHQIGNPNTKDLVTGWDVANFRGPLSWNEEEQRRARFKKIHWHEG